MILAHLFWSLLLGACVVWYSTITIYVAVAGFRDIRSMLKLLAERQDDQGD